MLLAGDTVDVLVGAREIPELLRDLHESEAELVHLKEADRKSWPETLLGGEVPTNPLEVRPHHVQQLDGLAEVRLLVPDFLADLLVEAVQQGHEREAHPERRDQQAEAAVLPHEQVPVEAELLQ